MTEVPVAAAETTPVEEPIVATLVLPLVQYPPVVVLPNVVTPPTQTVVAPVIADGELLTVTTDVVRQPPEMV